MKIGLCDLEFEHIKNPSHYTGYERPKYLEWDRITPEKNEIVCFTERCYEKAKEKRFYNCIRIAWPLEPKSIHNYAYENLLKYKNVFKYVFCFDTNYWNKFSQAGIQPVYWTPGGSYIYAKDWQIYQKTKNVQIIASKKDWTELHRLRHEIIRIYRNKIDGIYGRAYKYYNYQLEPFKDYRFAIVVENADFPDYWTDKLLDCFLTGTIPIMYNSGWIRNHFNVNGIILWQDKKELGKILETLDDKLYNKLMPFIQENFKIAKEKYSIVEDYMFQNFFKEFDK